MYKDMKSLLDQEGVGLQMQFDSNLKGYVIPFYFGIGYLWATSKIKFCGQGNCILPVEYLHFMVFHVFKLKLEKSLDSIL